MTSPIYSDGERESSLEYLHEYGQLIADVASLADAFESRNIRSESETTFSFYGVDNEFEIPQSITTKIGEVSSANITFTEDESRSLSLELFGEKGSYVASRSEETTPESATDTFFYFRPLDSIEQNSLGISERSELLRVSGDGQDFEKMFENINGLSNADLLMMLMQISHPDIKANLALKRKAVPENIDLFQPDIHASLIESARTTSIKQMGHLRYDILTTDNSSLVYFFEAGQPESFHLKTVDDVNGRELKLSGVVDTNIYGQASMSLQAPRHAESTGGLSSRDLPIDTVYYDAPTLREVKLMRTIIAEEILSLPEPEPSTSSIETVQIAVSTKDFDSINQQVDDTITFNNMMLDSAFDTLQEE